MARVAKASKTARSATIAPKAGSRKIGSRQTARSSASSATDVRKPGRPASTLPAPKVSKDELRAQVEKLGQLVASLRAKSRESNKAAKAATAHIAELEAQVARLEKKAAVASSPVRETKSAKPSRVKRRSREIVAGDGVQPGVAAQEPESPDGGAETAVDHMDAHLTDE